MKRRKFLQNASLSSLGMVATASVIGCKKSTENTAIIVGAKTAIKPIFLFCNLFEIIVEYTQLKTGNCRLLV